MDKNYIVTMTSGSYDDYEHGNVFAVKNEEEGLKIVDLLNAYSNFRSRWREEFYATWIEGDSQISLRELRELGSDALALHLKATDARHKKLREKYSVPDDLKDAERLMSDIKMEYLLNLAYPEYWPEDCVFALEVIPVVEFENGN